MKSFPIQFLSILLFLFITLPHVMAQSKFEEGYYINNTGNRIEGLISNEDWRSNPIEIEFKSNEDAEVVTILKNSIQEFGIHNYGKFIRATVLIDRSSDNYNQLSTSDTPVFNSESLLLRVLVEGYNTVYSYTDGNISRFFYKNSENQILQLVNRKYLDQKSSVLKVREDKTFRIQLLNELSCIASQNEYDFFEIKYRKKEIVRLFVDNNKCSNSTYNKYNYTNDRRIVIALKSGVSTTFLMLDNSTELPIQRDYSSEISFEPNILIGFELELGSGFNNGAWSLLINPMYQQYNLNAVSSSNYNYDIDFKAIQIHLGLRRYLFINQNPIAYLEGYYIYGIAFNSSFDVIDLNGNLWEYRAGPSPNLKLGLGVKPFHRVGIDVNYNFRHSLYSKTASWVNDYRAIYMGVRIELFED